MGARRLRLRVVRSLGAVALISLCALGGVGTLTAPAALAEGSCPNALARQGPSGALPDCRAYEQVTPVDKGDATDLFAPEGVTGAVPSITADGGFSSVDGNGFLMEATLASFPDGGVSGRNAYVFSRGADGWSTTAVAPPSHEVQSVSATVFDPTDFSRVGIESVHGSFYSTGLEGANVQRVDAVGSPGGAFATMASAPPQSLEESRIAGASADLGHVVLQSLDHELAAGATGQDPVSQSLYDYSGRRLSLVNVNTDGSLVSRCGAILGQGGANLELKFVSEPPPGSNHNAVSADGSRIVFTAPDPAREGAGCWNYESNPQENPPQLYMRIDGRTTVQISAPNTGVVDSTGPHPAVYVGASADDSKVFFVSTAQLTADDTTHAPELYEYDSEALEGKRLVRVSGGESGSAEGDVQFVPAVSEDGKMVYFAAYGRLAPGAIEEHRGDGGKGANSQNGFDSVNLYRYDTSTGKTTYITTINAGDYPMATVNKISLVDWWVHDPSFPGEGVDLGPDATQANWYATPDGQYLVFGSLRPLTGYDNTVGGIGVRCEGLATIGNGNPEICVELYRYDASANSIVCVSCGATGVRPIDNATFANSAPLGVNPSGVSPRPVSEDGKYVFFQTANALVPGTSPGREHVYEWHDGTVSLISSPGDLSGAFFLGSSADGSNVFFGTHAQLVAQDTDVSGDVYDARIDGGFGGLTPSLCTGTGCQGVPGAPPVFATPASVTFEGVGNFPAGSSNKALKPRAMPKCGRGSVRRHGRCVRKKARRVRKASKSSSSARGRK
jgi:hypothetical protein